MTVNAIARTAFDFFVKNGFSPAQACGLLGNIQAESNFNPLARGDGGLAHGICQWHPDRCVVIKVGCGIDIMHGASFEQQLEAIVWELNHVETVALYHLKLCKTAFDAGHVVAQYYERPASSAQWDYRGKLATSWFLAFAAETQSGS